MLAGAAWVRWLFWSHASGSCCASALFFKATLDKSGRCFRGNSTDSRGLFSYRFRV
ncbi:hypothetical protein PF010_g26491 [Phytophthora fragariae]|uniref:Secreted protein n=1 Tax=Phytophthora fragariae TaxID=53985 RepID=A0A6G0MHV8_9STRA|nr:hypothetical protein PF010_g26491 [Phytophthora fragariae]KAE9167818.1 hypothetical protein PF004_g28696 [Phytophthora fragariae]